MCVGLQKVQAAYATVLGIVCPENRWFLLCPCLQPMAKMELLITVRVVFVLSSVVPATKSHRLHHVGELINRDNAKIMLGKTNLELTARLLLRCEEFAWNSQSWMSLDLCAPYPHMCRVFHKGECLPCQLPDLGRLGQDVMAVCQQPLSLWLDWSLFSASQWYLPHQSINTGSSQSAG